MRHLTLAEVIALHRRIVASTGGAGGIRDFGMLLSAVAQPRMTFGGSELYQTVVDKACALGFSLIRNHPFVDGNKRVGHAAMEVLLALNDVSLVADVDNAERVILGVAAGNIDREELLAWLKANTHPNP